MDQGRWEDRLCSRDNLLFSVLCLGLILVSILVHNGNYNGIYFLYFCVLAELVLMVINSTFCAIVEQFKSGSGWLYVIIS